ncbi:MAG: hypothetical protein ACE5GI_04540 [Candidatus Aminicenantales bacterium]
MEREKREIIESNQEIKIDYDHIDVGEIMDQIKQKIAREGRSDQENRKSPWAEPISPRFSPELEKAVGLKNKLKRILLKIMKPFSPVIKLLILPVYDEFRHTVYILDQTNKKIDDLYVYEHERKMEGREYIKLLHNLSHNIVVELTKLKIEEENLKIKLRILEKDFEFLRKRERALEKHLFR